MNSYLEMSAERKYFKFLLGALFFNHLLSSGDAQTLKTPVPHPKRHTLIHMTSCYAVVDTTHVMQVEPEEVYTIVEKNASFQGGDINDFRKYVQSKLVYPPDVQKMGLEGTVLVQFDVESTGKLSNAEILRGIFPSVNDEVLRVLKNSPLWIPAIKNDFFVTQQFTIPVIFSLNEVHNH